MIMWGLRVPVLAGVPFECCREDATVLGRMHQECAVVCTLCLSWCAVCVCVKDRVFAQIPAIDAMPDN
jgi:hypothetical protein